MRQLTEKDDEFLAKQDKERPYGLYTASDAVEATLDTIEDRREQVRTNTAIARPFDIPLIDHYIKPWWRGQTIYVVALMSNGKSFTSRMFAVNALKSIMESNSDNRVVVWVTVEEPVEQVTAAWMSAMGTVSSSKMMSGGINDVEMYHLKGQIAEISTWPLFIVGHTLSQREDGVRKRGSLLTRGQIEECLDYIMNFLGRDIALLVIDYMQRIDFDDGDYGKMEPHMRKTVDWNRAMARWTACPLISCAQAPRSVADKRIPTAGMTEIEWTNKAGQDADMIISPSFPKTKYGTGQKLEDFEIGYDFDERGFLVSKSVSAITIRNTHLFVRVPKNRGGEAGGLFLLDAKPWAMEWELLTPRSLEEEMLKNRGAVDLSEMQAAQEALEAPEEQQEIPF